MSPTQETKSSPARDSDQPVARRLGQFLDRRLGPDWPWLAAVWLVAFIAAWPAVSQPGLLNTRGGGDSPFLLQRLHQLTTALAEGHFPVRWMPDANYGYGYPFYNFYAPLSIYIAAFFRLIGFSFVRAIHLAQLAGFVVAGLGMFYLARGWLGSRWAGLLATVAYTVAPFHMVNVYVRGDSLAEFWAMAFYPLVLLAADGLLDAATGHGSRATVGRRLSLFALTYAALILSHNISALIFSPFLLLYLGVRLLNAGQRPPATDREQRLAGSRIRANLRLSSVIRHPSAIMFVALVLAFALAAWFFIPALAEQDLAQLGPVTEGYFHYSNHFRGLDLVQAGLIFDYNPDGGVAFRLGLAQAVLALAGAVALVVLWQRLRTTGYRSQTTARGLSSVVRSPVPAVILLGALVALFMITPLSRPLWDRLPLLHFTQFPWRFLSVASFFMALLTGALVLVSDRPAARAGITVLGGLVLLAAGLLGLRTDHLILTDEDATAERLAQYEWFTGNIGTTVSAEYLTPESAPRPWTSAWLNNGDRDRVVALDGTLLAAQLTDRQATRQNWTVNVDRSDTTVLFPTMNWPYWLKPFDSYNVTMDTQPGSGLMSTPLDRGEQAIYLQLSRTPIRAAAELLSLLAFLMAAMLLVMSGRPSAARVGRVAIAGGIVLLSMALLGFFWRDDPRELSSGDLTWDFAQMAYLHHDVSGVTFDNGGRLHQYGFSGDELMAGETLTVTLSVTPGDGREATLALVTPATARPSTEGMASPPAIAADTQPLDADTVVFALPISRDAPPGLYIPRLTIDGAQPLMPSGATRGDLFLRPVRIVTSDELRVTSSDQQQATNGPVDVRAISLKMRDETTLDGRLAWYTDRPLGERYQFSWRLQDAPGGILAQLDAQPGYGYQPSDGWPAGRWTADWLALQLPDTAPAQSDYPLVMRLYDVATGETVLVRRVGIVSWNGETWQPRQHEPSFTLSNDLTPLDATFGRNGEPFIALRGSRLEREGGAQRLTLYWEALADVPYEYTRFVHLIGPTGDIVAQVDSAPAGDSYPTGQWVAGEIVADMVTFETGNLPPGEYRVATGFYQPVEDLPPVSALGPDGPLPDGRAFLPETITLP